MSALEAVELKDFVEEHGGIHGLLTENGGNASIGQRQVGQRSPLPLPPPSPLLLPCRRSLTCAVCVSIWLWMCWWCPCCCPWCRVWRDGVQLLCLARAILRGSKGAWWFASPFPPFRPRHSVLAWSFSIANVVECVVLVAVGFGCCCAPYHACCLRGVQCLSWMSQLPTWTSRRTLR